MQSAYEIPSRIAETLTPFDYTPRTRLIFGPDSLERVGEVARELGAKRALLVTDAGIVAAGHAGRAVGFIAAAGLQVEVYDRVHENPTTRDVAECVDAARAANADILIGLGGGSSMDTAKGCNFILTNGGEMKDYWGVGKATKPMLPMIAVPTTSGTGSECQSAALIADEATHQKMACLDAKAAARIAILDPLLTVSQPPKVTAATGIDALTHALETAVTRKRNGISKVFSHESFRLCFLSLSHVLENPADVEARARMQLGAAYAGTAVENSMLGAVHSAANPLTAHHGVVHGQAVGIMMPIVMRFNARVPEAAAIYAELARSVGLPTVEALAEEFTALLARSGLLAPLRDLGVRQEGIAALAEEAAKQWTAQFNPRDVTSEAFTGMYEEAL
jgi:alcohol dehydrogenase